MTDDKAYRYRKRLEYAGICMSCLDGAPDNFGCSDCLNTGYAGCDPREEEVMVHIRMLDPETRKPDYITTVGLSADGSVYELPPLVTGKSYITTVQVTKRLLNEDGNPVKDRSGSSQGL